MENGVVEFVAGQVWSYQTREQETDSVAIVLRVERVPRLGTIVHVQLNGLSVQNPAALGGVSPVITHVPVTAAALRLSVTELLSDAGTPKPFEEGYRQWREAFDANQAGAWSVPLAQIIYATEITLMAAGAPTEPERKLSAMPNLPRRRR